MGSFITCLLYQFCKGRENLYEVTEHERVRRRLTCSLDEWELPILSLFKALGWLVTFSSSDGEHFASFRYGNSFPFARCTTSLLMSFSFLSGQGISWSLDRKRAARCLATRFSRFDSLGVCEGRSLSWSRATYEWAGREVRQRCRVLYQRNACQYLAKNSIILRYTECMNFVTCSLWKFIYFSNIL
jgi:hypothetical protein